MIYPAFEARALTAELQDRRLMELWKWAANEGQVQAVSLGGKNYAVVKDDDLAARLRACGLREYRYDDDKGTLIP